ncbi:hypothetical protein V2J09_002604 [Rumex salicifolius]
MAKLINPNPTILLSSSSSHYFLLIFLLPAMAAGDCTCDTGNIQKDTKAAVLPYKLGALVGTLAASMAGVLIPLAWQRFRSAKPDDGDGGVFFMVKAFAAGVILSTGFIHILPDAFDNLTSPCLTEAWRRFPFAGLVAMAAAVGTLMVESTATGYYGRRMRLFEEGKKAAEVVVVDEEGGGGGRLHVHTHASHGHAHGDGARVVPEEKASRLDFIRHRVTSQVLEVGVMVHSVIIGVTVGASGSLLTIKPLMFALSFHQFFEGMGLAGCISQAKFKWQAIITISVFFTLTTPLGIAIGIIISNIYSDTKPAALIVEGVLGSASAGILIYMALVDLLAADFMSPRVQNNPRIQLGSNISLLLGAAFSAYT